MKERLCTDRRTPLDALPEFLSAEEFRECVGISRSTVYDLLRRDEIPQQEEVQVGADPGPVAAAKPEAADQVELGGKLRPEHRVVELLVGRIELREEVLIAGHRPRL